MMHFQAMICLHIENKSKCIIESQNEEINAQR